MSISWYDNFDFEKKKRRVFLMNLMNNFSIFQAFGTQNLLQE